MLDAPQVVLYLPRFSKIQTLANRLNGVFQGLNNLFVSGLRTQPKTVPEPAHKALLLDILVFQLKIEFGGPKNI